MLAVIGSTVEYLADGKVGMFSKADIRKEIIAVAQASVSAPETTKESLSSTVLFLNGNREEVLTGEAYTEAAKAAANFVLLLDQKANELKKSGQPARVSLDQALSLIKSSHPSFASLSDRERNGHLKVGFNLLALNEVYVSEFDSYYKQASAN
jgi:hypothetical protein